MKVLVLPVIVGECNGLPTQTQQSTHALPFFGTYLGRIERESAALSPISRTIVPHLSDFGACPNTGTFTSNPQSSHKVVHLLTPNMQKKHIDRSSSAMVAKYQKLYSNSQRTFPSNNLTSMLRTVVVMESDS